MGQYHLQYHPRAPQIESLFQIKFCESTFNSYWVIMWTTSQALIMHEAVRQLHMAHWQCHQKAPRVRSFFFFRKVLEISTPSPILYHQTVPCYSYPAKFVNQYSIPFELCITLANQFGTNYGYDGHEDQGQHDPQAIPSKIMQCCSHPARFMDFFDKIIVTLLTRMHGTDRRTWW